MVVYSGVRCCTAVFSVDQLVYNDVCQCMVVYGGVLWCTVVYFQDAQWRYFIFICWSRMVFSL